MRFAFFDLSPTADFMPARKDAFALYLIADCAHPALSLYMQTINYSLLSRKSSLHLYSVYIIYICLNSLESKNATQVITKLTSDSLVSTLMLSQHIFYVYSLVCKKVVRHKVDSSTQHLVRYQKLEVRKCPLLV